MAVGGAAGASVAGVVADRAGPAAAFTLAGGAGALALIASMLRSGTIESTPSAAGQPAAPTATGLRDTVTSMHRAWCRLSRKLERREPTLRVLPDA
jgi:hypothetical protein